MSERIDGLKKVKQIMLEIYASDIHAQDLRDAALETAEMIERRISYIGVMERAGGEKMLGGEYHE